MPARALTALTALTVLSRSSWSVRADALKHLATLTAAYATYLELEVADDATKRQTYRFDGSVAVVEADGILVDAPYESWFPWLGLASTPELSGAVDAVASLNPSALLLCVRSPGGHVSGIADLSDKLFSLRKQFPVVVAARELCSAAYWFGSQANRVYLTQDGYAGSLGTVMTVEDLSKLYADMGVKVVNITSSGAEEYKAAGTPGTTVTKAQQDDFKRIADSLMTLFKASVARGRDMTPKTVDKLSDGRVFVGQEAVSLGLADGIATENEVLTILKGG